MPYFDSIQTILNKVYPVGSVVTFGVSTNPATLLGIGTWTAIAGRVIVGIDSGQTEFDTLDETGGAKTHTLVSGEMPSHTHTQDAHTHTQNAHTHVQDAHSHGLPGWTGGALVGASTTGTAQANNYGSATTTATNQNTTATNQNTTATNQNTGGGGAHNNLQPYIVKYVWQRTA